jgi:hypothetical protein
MITLNEKNLNEFFNSDNNKIETELCSLFKKYGSDKSSDWHNYSTFYNLLFKEVKNDNLNIFELGIYGGGSVRAWNDYFTNSKIYCGDVNHSYFINENNISSFFCNQDDVQSINEMWKIGELDNILFDIIIDDGKHEYSSNYNFLLNSYHKLKKSGIFIVEDLTESTFNNFKNYLPNFIENNNPSFIKLLRIENPNNRIDNNILIIQK